MLNLYHLSQTPVTGIRELLLGCPLTCYEVASHSQLIERVCLYPQDVGILQVPVCSFDDQQEGPNLIMLLHQNNLKIINQVCYKQIDYWIISGDYSPKSLLQKSHRCIFYWFNTKTQECKNEQDLLLQKYDNETWEGDKEQQLLLRKLILPEHRATLIENNLHRNLNVMSFFPVAYSQITDKEQNGQIWLPKPPTRLSGLHQTVVNLKSRGLVINGLHVGEMGQTPLRCVREAMVTAITKPEPMGYTEPQGYHTLRDGILQDLQQRKHIRGKNFSVLCTNGARQALFQSLLYFAGPTATEEGPSEVVIPTPCWGAYAEMATSVGAVPVYVKSLVDGNIDLSHLDSVLTSKTRFIVLCSPHNPTGTMISKANLLGLRDILRPYPEVRILSDEVYERLTFPGNQHISPASIDGLYGRCLTVGSFSKSHLMTGLRIGYVAGPTELINSLSKLQSCICTCPSSLSQYGAIAAITNTQGTSEMTVQLSERALQLENVFAKRIQGKLQGGYYAWIRLDKDLSPETETDVDFCFRLLQRGTAVAAGSYFGGVTDKQKFIRISFGCPENEFTQALHTMSDLLHVY